MHLSWNEIIWKKRTLLKMQILDKSREVQLMYAQKHFGKAFPQPSKV